MYLKQIMPIDLIYRFMTCNKPTIVSPQCRVVRFESCKNGGTTETMSKMKFNRIDERALRQQITAWLLPLSIHIGPLLALHLEPGSNMNDSGLTTKRKRDDEDSEEDITVHRHRDFVHFIPICKELVFDLDVHDFDRFCACVEKEESIDIDSNPKKTNTTQTKILCHHCWLHIEGAYFIMQFILTQLFGYNSANILYVFSGGKGIHCFVNDHRAMSLSEEQRYFMYDTIHIGSGKNPKDEESVDNDLCNWIIKYATPELSATLENLFMTHVIANRNLFVKCKAFRKWFLDKLCRYYPSTYSNMIKTQAWQDLTTESSILWELLKMFEIYDFHANITMVKPSLFIIYRLYYPIVDKGPLAMTHSIKLPFSIHTTTKNIALPFTQSFIESPDKCSQLVTLESVCVAYNTKKEYPSLFTNGATILDEWLNMYELQ